MGLHSDIKKLGAKIAFSLRKKPPVSYIAETVPANIFLSIGKDCTPALQLRRNNLRFCSSPLDWMTNYSLETAEAHFKTGFRDFFLHIKETERVTSRHRSVIDLDTKMLSLHHFPVAVSLLDGQKKMRDDAIRRFARIDSIIKRSRCISFVCRRDESPDAICHFMSKIHGIYGKKMIGINVRECDSPEKKIYNINKDLSLHDYSFSSLQKENESKYNHKVRIDYEWGRILSGCAIANDFAG